MINFPGFFGDGDGSSEILLLNLEKSQYKAGEKVKGYLTINSNKDTVPRAFRFIAEGKEETKVTVRESYSSSSSSSSSSYSSEYRTKTYTSSNVFFFQDLLEFLKANSLADIENGKDVIIKKGKTQIPFEFIIPYNIFSSYNGKNAWITYSIKATKDKKMKMDVNSSIIFDVISQHNNGSNISNSRPISVSTFKRNDLGLKLDLDKSVFNAGDTIRGTINIRKLNPDIDIRGIEIILTSTEKATASNRLASTIMFEDKYKIPGWKEKQNCPFEINIPDAIVRSYLGKYSEIRWEVKAKVDLPLSQDLNAEAMIEVI
jgi:Arrestin (or S-antigen), N-terminal domain